MEMRCISVELGLARFEVVCPLQIYAGDKVTLVHSLTVEQVKVFCGDKDPITTKDGVGGALVQTEK